MNELKLVECPCGESTLVYITDNPDSLKNGMKSTLNKKGILIVKSGEEFTCPGCTKPVNAK